MADIKDIDVEGLITELKATGSLGPKAEDHGYNLVAQLPESRLRGDFNLADELVVNRRAKDFLTDDQFEATGRAYQHGVEVFGDFRLQVCDYVPDGFIVGLRGDKVVAMWGPFKTREDM
jgi:hypothetical protein